MTMLHKIQELAEETAIKISSSPAAWTSYLDTAAQLYRYPFSDSLLIHAQRPDIMACASMRVWNKKMGRWIRKGAKGIALIDDTGPERRLWYVFDMADTRLLPGSRIPFLWQIPERHRETILELLVDTYQLDQGTGQLHTALFRIASSLTRVGLKAAMKGLDTQMEGSPLRGQDESMVRDTFQTLFRNSVFYVLARRCGLDPMDYLKPEDFAGITDFNSLMVLSFLGENTIQIAEPVLRDMGRKIRRIYQQETQKTLANESDLVYNEFNTLKYKSNKEKGETIYGTDLSSQRGLSVPEPDNRGTERDHRKVRDAAENLHEGEQEGLVSGAAPEREAGQLLSGDRQDGAGADGSDYGEPAGEVPGTGQGDRPDGLGVPYERPDGHGGGDGLNGTGLQLENTTENDMTEAEEETASALSLPELPSAEEQVYGIEKQAQSLYAGGSLIPEEVVDEVLRTGGNRRNSLYRIIYNFMSEQSPEEYTELIRKEYGTGGKGLEIGGCRYSVWFDKPGMQIAIGETVEEEKAGLGRRLLSWEEVSGRIHRLLKAGEYAPQEILDGARENAIQEHAEILLYMCQDMADKTGDGIFSDDEIVPGGFPERKAHIAGLLSQPEYVERLIGKLERLSESYRENRDIMRFHIYRPDQVLERFRKFAKEVSPYEARDGFTGKELPIFITQDEIDAYFCSHEPFANGRLDIYAFYQKNENSGERAGFLKKSYGTGGGSHALSGADDSFADYTSKGVRLTRGDLIQPKTEIFLKWTEAAERIASLIERERYLQPGDFARMELYERGQMANQVMQFYWGMPFQVARPWDGNPDNSSSSWYKEVVSLLSQPEGRTGLVRGMDQALAELPLDFKDYGERARILSELQGYTEGTYTLFPEQKRIRSGERGDGKEKEQKRELGQREPFEEEQSRKESQGRGKGQIQDEGRVQEAERKKGQNLGKQEENIEKSGSQERRPRSISVETNIPRQADSGSQNPDPEENRQMSLFDFMDNGGVMGASEVSGIQVLRADGQAGEGKKSDQETSSEENSEDKNPEDNTNRSESLLEKQERINFRITDDSLGTGGPKQKFRANLEVIGLLKTLESQGRLAVPDEQETLSKFVGWGGLAEAFDEKNKNWEKEYIQLKETLTPEEYREARATTLNAFYTPPVVIRAMYEALGNMGLKSGNLLEPSCGIGNFMGLVPEEMSGLKMYGVELDGISGRIARQLYQKNPIAIQSFESTDYPDSCRTAN